MKFKLRNQYITNVLIVIALLLSLIFAFTSSFYVQKLSGNTTDDNKKAIGTSNGKSLKIKEYVSKISDKLVAEVDINKEITSVITIEDNKYSSVIFNYESGEEINLESLITKEKQEEFWHKVKELLYLKYPKFIAEKLACNDGENVYYLKENELIIYYYNYTIEPMPKETLFLKVNYNEIKDYLNISVNLDSEYENEDGSKLDLNKKIIALTFDDGPGSYTQDLVDILNDNKAKATFFMLGKNIIKYPKTVQKVSDNGMEIGYHSYAHTNFKRQKLETIKSELDLSNEYLKNITGKTFELVRPPYGSLNDEIKNYLDVPFIFWNVDTEDWRHHDQKYLTDYVMNLVNDGDIILFHDIHKTSVEAMNSLLPLLYVNGYQVTTVSNLASSFGKTLNNKQIYRYFSR